LLRCTITGSITAHSINRLHAAFLSALVLFFAKLKWRLARRIDSHGADP
jgi:hypothetical protein